MINRRDIIKFIGGVLLVPSLLVSQTKKVIKFPPVVDELTKRRIIGHTKKIIKASSRDFLFEPNDSLTWDGMAQLVHKNLNPLTHPKGGMLKSYEITCNKTNNTPDTINRHEVHCRAKLVFKDSDFYILDVNCNAA